MGISADRHEEQYASDQQLFACVDMVVQEINAAKENGYGFSGMEDRCIAEDLHRYSAAAELWDFDMVLEAILLARQRIKFD